MKTESKLVIVVIIILIISRLTIPILRVETPTRIDFDPLLDSEDDFFTLRSSYSDFRRRAHHSPWNLVHIGVLMLAGAGLVLIFEYNKS